MKVKYSSSFGHNPKIKEWRWSRKCQNNIYNAYSNNGTSKFQHCRNGSVIDQLSGVDSEQMMMFPFLCIGQSGGGRFSKHENKRILAIQLNFRRKPNIIVHWRFQTVLN